MGSNGYWDWKSGKSNRRRRARSKLVALRGGLNLCKGQFMKGARTPSSASSCVPCCEAAVERAMGGDELADEGVRAPFMNWPCFGRPSQAAERNRMHREGHARIYRATIRPSLWCIDV